jgi:hypothetical protein
MQRISASVRETCAMSTRTDADPGGYIRFPRAWMALSISPGAKCLLLHFCGAADAAGASWYSYAQLGAILQRSRSSVAAYVAELRDARVIEPSARKRPTDSTTACAFGSSAGRAS